MAKQQKSIPFKEILGNDIKLRNVEVNGNLTNLHINLPSEFTRYNDIDIGSDLVIAYSKRAIIIMPIQKEHSTCDV